MSRSGFCKLGKEKGNSFKKDLLKAELIIKYVPSNYSF